MDREKPEDQMENEGGHVNNDWEDDGA